MDGIQLGLSLRTSQDSCQPTEVMRWAGSSTSWPASGRWSSSGEWWTRSTSGCPNGDDACSSSLASILEPEVPTRYFLSARAARGILNRSQRRGRTLPEPLAAALSALAGGGLSDSAVALTARPPGDRRVESNAVTLILAERERETVNALTNLGSGGPDDNDAQAGHLIVQPRSSQAKDAATETTSTAPHG